MFSTNYIPEDEHQSLEITNIDDISNQACHLVNNLFVLFFLFFLQLNTNLNENKTRVFGAFFRDFSSLKGQRQ